MLFLSLCLLLFPLIKAQDCLLQVPNDPLNSGLFQPWFLSTKPGSPLPCSQTIPNAAVFVEATILDITTGNLFIYNPLVLDINTTPAVPINIAVLPANNVVMLNIGANGNSVTLITTINSSYGPYGAPTDSMKIGRCINGFSNNDIFGQVAYCNGFQFYQIVFQMIAKNNIALTPLGLSLSGLSCPTTRSFAIIDQDQSDNVVSSYLLTSNEQVAQDTPANRANLNVVRVLSNGSDNRLIDKFIDAAIGCMPLLAPDLFDNAIMKSSQTLNEIHAYAFQVQPTALVPYFDPMVLTKGKPNIIKLNLYRVSVGQPPLLDLNVTNEMIFYCNSMIAIAPQFLKSHYNLLFNYPSPDATGNNLVNFLANRFFNSWINLKCDVFTGLPSPIQVILDINGTAIGNNLLSMRNLFSINFFCGYSFNNLDCNMPCPQGVNSECKNNQVCFQDSRNICSINSPSTSFVPPTVVTTLPTILPTTLPTILPTTLPTTSFLSTLSSLSTNAPTTVTTSSPSLTSSILTNTNFCGQTYNNLNCNAPCPSGLNSECQFTVDTCYVDSTNMCRVTTTTPLIVSTSSPIDMTTNNTTNTTNSVQSQGERKDELSTKLLLLLYFLISLFLS